MAVALQRALESKAPGIPVGGALVWRWFLDLNRTRSSSGFAPNPLTYSEIEAYARLYRWPLEPRHVDMIMAMDRVWIAHARSNMGGESMINSAGASQEITPEAFDAVFA